MERAKRLEKTEALRSWKSQWGDWFGRCRGSRRVRNMKERKALDPGTGSCRMGELSPIFSMTILLNALLYSKTGNLIIAFLRVPCQQSFSLESSNKRHWFWFYKMEEEKPFFSSCSYGQAHEHRQVADIWADMSRLPGILLRITDFGAAKTEVFSIGFYSLFNSNSAFSDFRSPGSSRDCVIL